MGGAAGSLAGARGDPAAACACGCACASAISSSCCSSPEALAARFQLYGRARECYGWNRSVREQDVEEDQLALKEEGDSKVDRGEAENEQSASDGEADLETQSADLTQLCDRLGALESEFMSMAKAHDPWFLSSPGDASENLIHNGEELPELCLDAGLAPCQVREQSSTFLEELICQQEQQQEKEDSAPQAIAIAVSGAGDIPLCCDEIRNYIVSLKLDACDNNEIEFVPMQFGAPWLRSLTLGACSFPSINFSGCFSLVHLDLSYSNLCSDEIDFAPLGSTLLRLVADGCSWSALPNSIGALKCLTFLSAQENEISEINDELFVILHELSRLRELDLRENPFYDEAGQAAVRAYRERMVLAIPGLEMLDNKSLRITGGAATMRLENIKGLREDMNRTDTVADQNEDRGNCSCIEGTPCETEYTCKDWKNRDTVARIARENRA